MKEFNKMTPLHLAVKNENIDIIKLLLDHKSINVNIYDDILYYRLIKFLLIFSHDFYYGSCKKPVDYTTNSEIIQLLNH